MPSLSLLPNLTESVNAFSQLAAAVNETDTQARCIDITYYRTIWNIVWSCLATIFACAWVAVHRNIPDPTSGMIRVSLDRVAITICALLVPEYMIGWAARQWLVARRIAKNEKLAEKARMQWTVTHGFFALMGGFYYLEPGNTPRPLSPKEVEYCIKDGILELPKKSDINDKSKGDALSKFFASLQTIWFVMQSIARPLQQLPLTKLEIATLAYTSINVAMYGFWWSKPLSVSRPVRVRRSNVPDPTTITESTTLTPFQKLNKKLETLMKAVMGSQDGDTDLSKSRQVPTFYAGEPDEWESIQADAIALVFAMVFGAIHCIAWSFAFPSHAEKLIWRMASIALVGVPAIYIFLLVFWATESEVAVKAMLILSLIGIPFYLMARVVLLVLAFTTLRSLPPAAFETVHWTTFIPHI
ncbi:hypothetical protein FIBSPDRAFT_990536 [Athelia psychrophila]|uniref:Uncharacterized protein n=1 Tax=Athelia psychrophila TaxID=1759441 RepID=A0A166WU53_9AGAM|nr:hypothetical protein FIBSPDRAFT_990536 [Fibularhizoctonia sp. CBS 109695]